MGEDLPNLKMDLVVWREIYCSVLIVIMPRHPPPYVPARGPLRAKHVGPMARRSLLRGKRRALTALLLAGMLSAPRYAQLVSTNSNL